MKFLDARKQDGKGPKASVTQDDVQNKMRPGSRPDQRNPEDLVSSPRARSGNTQRSSAADVDEKVQKLAGELNVDLAKVTGTGDKGAITEKDVRLAYRQQQGQQENK